MNVFFLFDEKLFVIYKENWKLNTSSNHDVCRLVANCPASCWTDENVKDYNRP